MKTFYFKGAVSGKQIKKLNKLGSLLRSCFEWGGNEFLTISFCYSFEFPCHKSADKITNFKHIMLIRTLVLVCCGTFLSDFIFFGFWNRFGFISRQHTTNKTKRKNWRIPRWNCLRGSVFIPFSLLLSFYFISYTC